MRELIANMYLGCVFESSMPIWVSLKEGGMDGVLLGCPEKKYSLKITIPKLCGTSARQSPDEGVTGTPILVLEVMNRSRICFI